MNDDVTRALPHAVGAEKSLLSSMLSDPGQHIPAAIEKGLTVEHFYLPGHQILYSQLLDHLDNDREIELISLTQHLLDTGKLDRVGGPAALTDIYTYSPSSAHFERHADIVIEKFVLRQIISKSQDAIQEAYDSPDEAWSTLDGAESQIMAIRAQARPERASSKREALNDVVNDMAMIINGEKHKLGLSTGFEELDRKTGGLKPGELFIVGARPSMGKSALMMNIVENIAVDQNLPTIVFSLEMPQKQLYARTIYGRAKYNPRQLETPDKLMLEKIRRVTKDIMVAPIEIDDTPSLTITEIRARARRAKQKHGIKFIAIDYLQLCKSRSKQAEFSREREVAEISAGAKAMAKELEVPVLLLAQLNRDSEKRSGDTKGIPRMSDLRESGAIEQDADYIGLLHREAYQAINDEQKEAIGGRSRLILAKNRNGETGDIWLTFIPELVRFEAGFRPETEPEKEPEQTRFRKLRS